MHQIQSEKPISRAELAALTEWGGSRFTLVEPVELPDHEAAVSGDVRYLRFRSGLTMHCSSTLEIRNLTTQVVQEPGLSCFLFLEGSVEMRLGTQTFQLGASVDVSGAHSPSGVIINCAKEDLLTRVSEKGRYIRKLVITLPADWCRAETGLGPADNTELQCFCGTHLASAR